jgi:hypothetical protein
MHRHLFLALILYIEVMRDPISSVLLRQTVLANKHLITRFKSAASNNFQVGSNISEEEDADPLPMLKIDQGEVDKILQEYQDCILHTR